MGILKNLFNNGTSGGGPSGKMPVGSKPGNGKGNGNGKGPINPPSNTGGNNGFVNPIKSGLPTKSDPLSTQKAQYPGYGFDKNKVNVASNTITSHGTKPGNQATTPSKQTTTSIGTKKYTGKDSYVDVLGKTGKFNDQTFDQMLVGAEGKPHFADTPENRTKWEAYHKPTTTGTPAKEADVSVPIKLDTNKAEESTTGEATVETETTKIDTTTAKNGPMAFGSAGVSKKSTGRVGSNPIKPVSLATSASQSKDFNLKLNNQAVNKA